MQSQKCGRAYHFPFSPGTTSDDRFNHTYWEDIQRIETLVHTEKLDGENNCLNQFGVLLPETLENILFGIYAKCVQICPQRSCENRLALDSQLETCKIDLGNGLQKGGDMRNNTRRNSNNTSYVFTKPFHKSQEIVKECGCGVEDLDI